MPTFLNHVIISGSVTTTTGFIGNGSGVTGVVSTSYANSVQFANITGTPTLISSSAQFGTGSNISFGSITASIVSASTFIGDGSQVTGVISASHAVNADIVPFSGITGKPTLVSSSLQFTSNDNVTFGKITASIVSASTLIGDGSNVTGVVSASHANTSDLALLANTASLANSVAFANITGKPTLISSSLQFTSADNVAFGKITASIVSASSFIGDGSGITGVSASVIDFANIINKPTLVSSSLQFKNTDDVTFRNVTASSQRLSNNLFVSGSTLFGGPGSHSFELQADPVSPANLGPVLTFRNASGDIKGQLGHFNADLGRLIIAGGDLANESLASMQFGISEVKLQTTGNGYGFDLTQTALTFQNGTPLYITGPVTASIISASSTITAGNVIVPRSLNTSTRILSDSNNSSSVDWQSRILRDSSEGLSVNWDSKLYYDSVGSVSVDAAAHRLYNGGALNLAWGDMTLLSAGTITVDWNSRLLKASVGNSVDWGNRTLIDSSTSSSLNWDTRFLSGSWSISQGLTVGNITASNQTLTGNLIVNGNLLVNGATTTISSSTLDITDRVIHVNHYTGSNVPAPTLIAGISVHRGSSASIDRDHAGLFWDETFQSWKLAFNTLGDDATVGSLLPLSASAYYGDGSGLTGVSASSVAFANITGKPSLVSSSLQFKNTDDVTFRNITASTLTLSSDLSVNGNTTLGDASGDSLTINGTTINTPNGFTGFGAMSYSTSSGNTTLGGNNVILNGTVLVLTGSATIFDRGDGGSSGWLTHQPSTPTPGTQSISVWNAVGRDDSNSQMSGVRQIAFYRTGSKQKFAVGFGGNGQFIADEPALVVEQPGNTSISARVGIGMAFPDVNYMLHVTGSSLFGNNVVVSGSIKVTQNITTSIISASTLIGDGSNITGISSASHAILADTASYTVLAQTASLANSVSFANITGKPTLVSSSLQFKNTDDVTFRNITASIISASTYIGLPRFAQDIGNGVSSSFQVTHSLGTRDVNVVVYDNSSFLTVFPDVTRTTINVVTVDFFSPPSASQYRCVVQA